MSRRTAVYRFYDSANVLLYVGITDDPKSRWKGHAADKDWWPQVACNEVEWLPDRDSALIAEAYAIRDEKPLHNIAWADPDGLAVRMAEEAEERAEAAAEADSAPRCPCCKEMLPALKVCANEKCRKTYYRSEAGRADAVFCSLACAQEAPMTLKDRRTRQKRESGR